MQILQDIKQEILKPNPFFIKTERVENVVPKQFSDQKKYSFYIRIFLEVNPHFSGKNPLTLDDIAFVKYHLHSSYKERTRISETRLQNFEIKVWAYGSYQMFALIYPKIGNVKMIEGTARIYVTPEEKLKYNL